VIIAFSPTDLPWPVAPATSRCGIFVRSTMYGSFVIVRPRARGISNLDSMNAFDAIRDRIETISGFLFGTSIPTVPLPGIGAMILMPIAERLSAISSSSDLMRASFTPRSGIISYKVTVGPTVAEICCMLIL